MNIFFNIFGSGKGIIRYLAPQTRLICCLVLLMACILSDINNFSGIIFITVIVIVWNALCGVPFKINLKILSVAMLFFLPILFFIPWIESYDEKKVFSNSLTFLFCIIFHGTSCLLISISGIASLTQTEFYSAIYSLPIPKIFSVLIVQIIHQTMMLFDETKRVVTAIQMRGGNSNLFLGCKVIFSLPVIWMLRIINRAERISSAMTVRGYDIKYLPSNIGKPLPADLYAILTVFLIFASSIIITYKV